MLDPGDLLSQVYRAETGPALFDEGNAHSALRAALEQGVLLDVGHGLYGFDFDVARRALDAGIRPHVISSGLYGDCLNHVVFDLPTTLSKFLALGMPLADVIRCATSHPARVLGIDVRFTIAPAGRQISGDAMAC